MSYIGNMQLTDLVSGIPARVSPIGSLAVTDPLRICGGGFLGVSGIDTNFWTETLAGTGAATVSGGLVALSTGTTANSAVSIVSTKKGRFLFAHPNMWRGIMRFHDTGVANNKRMFGSFDANNGCGFQLNGTTFGIFTRSGGSDTVVNSGSFNGAGGTTYSLDTNKHDLEVVYFVAAAYFYIDGVLIHTVTPTTAPMFAVVSNPITISNVNSGGGTSNVTLDCWATSIVRFGKTKGRAVFANITTKTTTVLKTGAGTLHQIIVNVAGSGTNRMTVYDNTVASGTIIGTFDTDLSRTIEFGGDGLDFNNGLTILTATGTQADITVMYD